MTDYHQPSFYRFNQDSLSLVRFILKKDLRPNNLLDIGAGSGVIGIELAMILKPQELTLLELQKDFIPYLEVNRDLFLKNQLHTHVEIIQSSLGNWMTTKTFDLIVCNPPYFLPGHGQESTDSRRNLCRNFKQDGWELLIKNISQWLNPLGRAFLVIKNDPALIKNCEEIIARSKLDQIFHFDESLCFIELYPRD